MANKKSKSSSPATKSLYTGIFGSLLVLFHLIAATQIIYGIWYDFSFVKFPETFEKPRNSFGGKFKFLTVLDAFIQAIYFTVCLLNDVIGSNEVAPKNVPAIRKVKDYLFSTLAFPIAFNVGISFWSLYAIDRELVFPKVLDAVFPSWLNHIMHTNIMIFMILEMFTSFRAYPKRSKGLTGLTVFMAAYLVWIHIVKHYSGVWVYPVLEVLQLPQRIVFFAVVLAFTVFLYYAGETINSIVWTKELKIAAKSKSK